MINNDNTVCTVPIHLANGKLLTRPNNHFYFLEAHKTGKIHSTRIEIKDSKTVPHLADPNIQQESENDTDSNSPHSSDNNIEKINGLASYYLVQYAGILCKGKLFLRVDLELQKV